jgi:hypothetical protein
MCKRTDVNGNRTLEPVRKQVKEDRRKMERPENGTEDSKERRGDRGRLTHAKLPPAAPGDLGSGDRDASPPRRKGEGARIVAGTRGGRARGQLKIQLMIQRVQDARGGECTVLWDSGAQVSLVTHEYAKGDSEDDLLQSGSQVWGQAAEASLVYSTKPS